MNDDLLCDVKNKDIIKLIDLIQITNYNFKSIKELT